MNAVNEANAKLESFAADAQKAATEQFEKATKSFEDVAAFNQENVDVVMKVANTAMKSIEEMNAEVASFSKKSVEEGVAVAKDLAASKNVMELVEKQTDFAKVAFDGYVKQMTKLNEMAMAASKEAMEPMTARMNAAAELAKGYAA